MKTLNEVNTQFNKYMVLQYAADGNKVVKHNIEMQLIKDNLYKGKIRTIPAGITKLVNCMPFIPIMI